ncbi:MAG: DJ-1/PfpI family protein [Erysipelotrichaceae bacterium]|nr:DJ-1/PfpI family protein [Erysipelotrichaceae bacterium]
MKCAIFLADGFETCEGLITIDMLRRASIPIDMISMNNTLEVTTSHGVRLFAEKLFSEIDPAEYDVLIMPGGKLGTINLESSEALKAVFRSHFERGALTCAICAAPSILGHMGILEGKKYTCFPSFNEDGFNGEYQMELAVTDGNLITGRGMGATIEFARQIIMALADEATLAKVEAGMQYEHSFRNNK